MIDVAMYWHFAPDLLPLGESPCVVSGSGFRILVEVDGRDPDPSSIQWEEYSYAGAYGEAQKASMLHIKCTVPLPWSVKTAFRVMQCAE
jgi:hypothetical protein